MELLAEQVRKLIYTIICFQCLLQLTEGNAYQKYLKLFSYILTMCICCNVILGFIGQMEKSLADADRMYAEWEKEWLEITEVEDIYIGGEYYEKNIWEEKIIGEAQSEYDNQKGDDEDAGQNHSHTEGEN